MTKLEKLNACEERLKAEKAVALAKDATEKARGELETARQDYREEPVKFRMQLREKAADWAVAEQDYQIAKIHWELARPRRQKREPVS